MGLQKTEFGTKLKVNSFMDYLVFKEIFIDKIYDEYIFHALNKCLQTNKPKKVIDLGANLGFFSVRCCEIWLQLGSNLKIDFMLYEPSLNCIGRIDKNLKCFSSRNISYNIWNNLVGKKSGFDWFIEDIDHHIGQCVSKRIDKKGNRYSRKIGYSDLSKNLETSIIDLIKCDIEGSEIEFVKNYNSSLKNVNSIIIETHGDEAKDFVCKKMKEIGFSIYNKKEIYNNSKYCNFYFTRKL